MSSQEIVVGSQTNINITMEEDVIGIEEVVAIGYGTEKKEMLSVHLQLCKQMRSYHLRLPRFQMHWPVKARSYVRQGDGLPGENYASS